MFIYLRDFLTPFDKRKIRCNLAATIVDHFQRTKCSKGKATYGSIFFTDRLLCTVVTSSAPLAVLL